jgi:hypothetical protein
MLGLGDWLASTGIATAELGYFNKFGSEIWREPRGIAAGYRWPQFSIHRGSLQKLLLEEYDARIGSPRLHAGWHLVSFEQDAGGVTARFVDKETGAPREEQRFGGRGWDSFGRQAAVLSERGETALLRPCALARCF